MTTSEKSLSRRALIATVIVSVLSALIAGIAIWGEISTAGGLIAWWDKVKVELHFPTIRSFATRMVGVTAIVAILILATRGVQSLFRLQAKRLSQKSYGSAEAFISIFGYVGVAFAGFVGLSLSGLDLSSLTIVVGALSVGIGFGLQGIAQDFISGILILVQRPIRVGDWIETTEGEGIVQKIGVRATEIETFNRQSLVIPNAQILSDTVRNWTLRDRTMRVRIDVGVAYDSDVDQVMSILKDCAEKDSIVLRRPKPQVIFENFGDSALEFSVRVFISASDKRLEVETTLRTAILKAFREANITIPFPQSDVHLIPSSAPSPDADRE